MAFTGGNNPFSSALVGALLRLFWICYRHGLEDSARSGDIDECEESVRRLKNVRRFGTVEVEMDWNEWQFKVLQWTREDICRARTMDLMMTLRRPIHPLGFLMQIAKMYYVRGVRDWVECSGWLTLEMVQGMPNCPYLLKRAQSYRPSQRNERFEFLQNECFNLIELQTVQADTSEQYAVPPSRIRAFVERSWSAMQNPKWFDDYDVEAERESGEELWPDKDKGLKNDGKGHGNKTKRERADKRVPRKDAYRGDAPANGAVLQSGAPKRRRGRPPKNV